MCYIKARDILPEEVIELIQQYIEGETIYIPKKKENKKSWGETTKIREEIKIRNSDIYKQYRDGCCKDFLAEKYFLSKKSIERIILQERKS